ncbi:MAG: D-glycero-beta-D-manno-heptose 1,7-bisphosphate 7-phosphatase [archaeon]
MKAALIDRDGTINADIGYLNKPEEWQFIKGAEKALKRIQDAGFRLVIITSQSGIGRGYYSVDDMHRVHEHMKGLLAGHGVRIDGIYFCPHRPDEGCRCRKPDTLMIEDAQRDFGLDLRSCYVIGDKTADIKMGQNAGCRTILVMTGKGGRDGEFDARPDFVAEDIARAAEIIEREPGCKKQNPR